MTPGPVAQGGAAKTPNHHTPKMLSNLSSAWPGARRAPALAVAAVALLLLTPAISHADNYVINNGPSAPTPNTRVGAWTVFGGPQGNKTTWSLAAGDYIGPLGGSMLENVQDGVRINAPTGSAITIREAKLWWYVPSSQSGDYTTMSVVSNIRTLFAGAGGPVDQLATPSDFVLDDNTTSLQLSTFCSPDNAAGSCTIGADSAPDVELAGSQLTVNDPGTPSGSATGGALANSDTLSGTQSILYQATDNASGVRKVQLLVDGQVVGQTDYLASCPYDNFLACPAEVSDSLSWDTATVPDGTHDVALRMINPSNNGLVVGDHNITTANAPAFLGDPTVSGSALVGRTLTATPASTSSDPAAGSVTTGAQWLRCDSAGNNCSAIVGAVGQSYTLNESDLGRMVRYRENAANNDGTSTADSQAVGPAAEPPATGGTTGAGSTGGGTPGLGGSGGLAGTGGGGTSTVGTVATHPTTAPTTTPAKPGHGLRGTTAKWKVSLSVTVHNVSRRARLTLTGAVHTSPRPATGKLVKLQMRSRRLVRRRGRWVTVRGPWVTLVTLRTDRLGRFKATWRGQSVGTRSDQFRALAPHESGFRNSGGSSPAVTATQAS